MAKKKAKTNGATKGALVYLVLDKSGSMAPIQRDTIAGVNVFIGQTAEADADAKFSLLTFDTGINKVHSGVPVTDVPMLDGRSYRPGGGTALLDAVGHAIKSVDEMEEKPAKIVIVTMTDGQENGSHEYTRAAIKALISAREADGWQFLFLGANVDAFDEAGALGLGAPAASSATWQQSPMGTQAAYMATANSTGSFLRGSSVGASLTQANYDEALRSLSNAGTAPDNTTQAVDTTPTKPVARKR